MIKNLRRQKFSDVIPHENLNDKSILITGGTGTFGHAFVDYVLENYTPKRLIIFSRDEFKQYEMDARYKDHPKHACLRFFLGDVRDETRLEMALRGVDYVIHAAALKHVPAAEYNPFECIQTNVMGAQNLVMAALNQNVKKVLALSTDKAVSPVNLYGASKLAAEKIFTAAGGMAGNIDTRFAVVRYGNVMGSRGSVLPLFQKLIAQGAKSLPVTDERMTRFWLTIEEGVDFVLSSLALMEQSEIFVPKIPSLKITDLAKAVAPHLPYDIIGIRQGEKLHEAMISSDESRSTYEIEDRYVMLAKLPQDIPAYLKNYAPKPAPENFFYSSETNTDWLDISNLSAIQAKAA